MNLRAKRKELQGVNGALGLVAGLGGYIGNLYSYGLATFLMLAIWIVGATVINLLTDPPEKRTGRRASRRPCHDQAASPRPFSSASTPGIRPRNCM